MRKGKEKRQINSGRNESWVDDSSLISSSDASSDLESVGFIENEESANKIREKLKGVPLIGRLKRKYQYAITVTCSIMMLAIFSYTAYMAYEKSQTVKEVDVAVRNIDNLLLASKNSVNNYASLNNEELNKLSSNKKDIDKYISQLRANENINTGGISTLDNYWKTLSMKISIIEGSKDKLSHNETLIKNTLVSLNKDIDVMNKLIEKVSPRSDFGSHRSIYLSQILNDTQNLYSSIITLKTVNPDYEKTLIEINKYNSIVIQKIDALIKSGLPEDIKKDMSTLRENVSVSYNNINSIIIRMNPINTSLIKIKSPKENIEFAITQIKSSLISYEDKEVTQNYIISIVAFALFLLFFISIFVISSKELTKDLIVSEQQRKDLENAALRIVADINTISNGVYDFKVRNTVDGLMGLKDAINKLVDNLLDKFIDVHKFAVSVRSDANNYEHYHEIFLDKNNSQLSNKTELKESNKTIATLQVENDAKNTEIITSLISIDPEFREAYNGLKLYAQTYKEIERIKLNLNSKHTRLEDSFDKLKKGFDNISRLCEFLEALSINSEINSKKIHSGNNTSFNRIADDFNKKSSEIKAQCNNMQINIEDVKNDIFNINKNTEDLNKYHSDLQAYFNAIKKTFPSISKLFMLMNKNNNIFNNNNKKIKTIFEKNELILESVDDALKVNSGNLEEMKELNKSNKNKVIELTKTTMFVEQLNKD